MPGVEKMSITLTPELAEMVNKAVETGDYASTSEVIREALRDWRRKQLTRQQQIEEIRRLWDEGIKSGPGRFANADELIAEAERRYAVEQAEKEQR
jgi:antitoxin ParD1/3/4